MAKDSGGYCPEHSGLAADIQALKDNRKDQWDAINRLRNRPPIWATAIISLLCFLLGCSLTYAGLITRLAGKQARGQDYGDTGNIREAGLGIRETGLAEIRHGWDSGYLPDGIGLAGPCGYSPGLLLDSRPDGTAGLSTGGDRLGRAMGDGKEGK